MKFFFFSHSPKTFYFLYMKQMFQMTTSSELHKNKLGTIYSLVFPAVLA